MIQILLISLLAFAGPFDDYEDHLGKISQGEVFLRHTTSCCISGRTNLDALLVLKKAGEKPGELITAVAEGDIDGESQSVTHSAVLYKEKIFFLTEYSYPNTTEWQGSIWHWDDDKKEFVNPDSQSNEFHFKKVERPTPQVAYAEARNLIENGEVEKAWRSIDASRSKYFWDAMRTTNIMFQEKSGHPAQIQFLNYLSEVVLQKIKADKKAEAGVLLCRAWDVPDLASYVDGSENSDPCEIAKIKVEDEEREAPKEGYVLGDRNWKIPLRCLIRWNNFQIARTSEAVSLLNDLGYALDEAGYSEEAVKVLSEVLRVSPHRAVAHLNLADAYGHLGQVKKAEKHYKLYLKNLGPKGKATAAKRTSWSAQESKICNSIAPFKAAVEKRKSAVQVEKLLQEYLKAGGSEEVIVKNDFMYHGDYSMPYILAEDGYYSLASQYIRKELPLDQGKAVDLILEDKKARPQMLKKLEAFGLKDYEEKKKESQAENSKKYSSPKVGQEPDQKLSLIKNLPEPLRKKVLKAMGIPQEKQSITK